MTASFIPGLRLAREFHAEVAGPILAQAHPGLRYSAALIGWGSEVLGFDSERSTDHNWGPRLQLFLSSADAGRRTAELNALFAQRLPPSFRGYPTRFPRADRDEAARHWIDVAELGSWLTGQLGFDPRLPLTTLDWLATPTQRLAEITAGEVFHDGLGELNPARARLRWYPRDVWRYVLACQWQRIAQEEAFPGRCSEAGDELGSAVVTARLARDLMRLFLLMRRSYPPYSKWLGTAFARLPDAAAVTPHLALAVSATDWPAREPQLCRACEAAAALQNQLRLSQPVDPATRSFHDRPYQVLDAGRFTAALLAAISDPRIGALPATGAIDQFVDSTDALTDVPLLRATAGGAIQPAARRLPTR